METGSNPRYVSLALLGALLFGACGQVVTERSIDSVIYIDSAQALVLVDTDRTREHGMTAAEALSGSFTGYRVEYRATRRPEVVFQHGLPRVTSATASGLGDSVYLFTGGKEAYVYGTRTGKLTSFKLAESGLSPTYLLRWNPPDSILVTQVSQLGPARSDYSVLSLSTGRLRHLEASGLFGDSSDVPDFLVPLGRNLIGIFASDGAIDSAKVRNLDSSTIKDAAIPPYPIEAYPNPVLSVLVVRDEAFLALSLGPRSYRLPLRSAETLGAGPWEATPAYAFRCSPSLSHYYDIDDGNALNFYRSDSVGSAHYDLLK